MRTVLVVAALAASSALATLPAAPDTAKEQAKEAAAKSAWSDKVAAYKLCLVQDHVADAYRKAHQAAAPAMQTPPCTDPGPYATPITPNAQKPLEASEAHSPAGTAHSPPSSNATAAQLQGSKQ